MLGRGLAGALGAGDSVAAGVAEGDADGLAGGDGVAAGEATGETTATELEAGAPLQAVSAAARTTVAAARRTVAIRAMASVGAEIQALTLTRPYCPG